MTDNDKKEKVLVEPVLTEKIKEVVKEEQISQAESLDTAENIASKTTAEQDLKSAAQRSLSLFEETTQRNIAYAIIGVALLANFITVVVGSYALLNDIIPSALMVAVGTGALMQLNTLAGIVTGFYFVGKIKDSIARKPYGSGDRRV